MGPREDPTDYLGSNTMQRFEKTREKVDEDEIHYDSDETPTSLSSPETIDTVLEMEVGKRDSMNDVDLDVEQPEPSTSRNHLQDMLQNGVNWPLDVASTSSAPPMLSGGIPIKKPKTHIERIREGYSEKRRLFPKLRDKRASSDTSSKLDEKDRIIRLRKSRQELRKTSKDDDRGA